MSGRYGQVLNDNVDDIDAKRELSRTDLATEKVRRKGGDGTRQGRILSGSSD